MKNNYVQLNYIKTRNKIQNVPEIVEINIMNCATIHWTPIHEIIRDGLLINECSKLIFSQRE